jgi:EAL domain-containing protein (putative c-di-GMP-specific phosphodiesterase class I)
LGCFEVRISERSLASLRRPEHSLGELAEWGARLVIDEVGRSAISLPMLARIPLSGLQIERGLAIAAAAGDSSQRACRAVAAVATVLGVNAIAPGVDDAASRDRLAAAGFSQGLGDLYPVMTALDAQPRVDRETVAEWPRQISGEQT